MLLIIVINIIMIKRRLTTQKKTIFESLKKANTHLTADEVYNLVKKRLRNISLATVYRNLELMTESGLFDEVYIAGWPKWFEVKKYTSHGHLFCRHCGQLEDVVECSFCATEKMIEKEKNFKGEEFKYLIIGLCKICHAKRSRKK